MKRVIRLFPWRREVVQAEHLSKHYAKSSDGRTIIRIRLNSPESLLMPYESFPANFGSDITSDGVPSVLNLNQDLVNYLFARLAELDNQVPIILRLSLPNELTDEPTSHISSKTIQLAIQRYFTYLEGVRCQNLKQLVRDASLLATLGTSAMGLSVLLETMTANNEVAFAVPLVNQGVTVFGWLTFWEALANALWNWRPLYEQMRMCQRLQKTHLELVFE